MQHLDRVGGLLVSLSVAQPVHSLAADLTQLSLEDLMGIQVPHTTN